jgi:hypothetical protein
MSVRHFKCRYFLSGDMHCTQLYTVEPNLHIVLVTIYYDILWSAKYY